MTITLEQALELGLKPFEDDRHFCISCVHYKKDAYMGKCKVGQKQYPKLLNRCNMYLEKPILCTFPERDDFGMMKVISFLETNEEKPFWEI